MKLKRITLLNDLRICILALLFLIFIAGTVAGGLNITFIPGTPANNSESDQTYADINTSVNATDGSTAFINWENSLVGWWRLNNETDENSSHFVDRSSSGNNGTCTLPKCPTLTPGKFGNSSNFNGSNLSYIEVDTSASLNSSNITLEVWFNASNFSNDGEHPLIHKASNGSAKYQFMLSLANTTQNPTSSDFYISVGNNSVWVEVNDLLYNDSQWHYLAGTYNGTKMIMYYDGNAVGNNTSASGRITPYNTSLEFGKSSFEGNYKYYGGSIDEVRIHNRALSAAEINTSYNVTLNRLHNNFTGLAYGTYNYTAYVQNSTGVTNQTETRTLILAAASGTGGPVINGSAPTSSVSDTPGANRTFNITVDQTVNVSWYMNSTLISGNNTTNVMSANYTNTSAVSGIWNITAIVNNTNGSAQNVWIWTVSAASGTGGPVINGSAPTSSVSDTPGANRTFNITVNQTVNVSWYMNGTLIGTNSSTNVTNANYTNTSAVEGIWNVTAIANNSNGTAQNVWTWTVSQPLVINITNPANNSVNTTGYVNVTATLNLSGIAQYLTWDGVNYPMTPATTQNAGTVFYKNMTGLLSGEHTFSIFANSSVVSNTSETRVVTVNRTNETSIAGSINTTTFIVNETIVISAPSGNVTATIPNGTNASVGGSAITSISMDSLARVNSTFALGNNTMIGENLSAGPEGAVFSPDIQIRFNYTDAQLAAAGITESQLRIKFYNTTSGNWVEQTPYTLNNTSSPKYITANVSHFSTFALAAEVTEAGAPIISGFGPTSPVADTASDSRTFNITVDQTVNVSWYMNGSLLETDTSVTDANYTNTSAVEGTWNVTAVANNSNGSDQNVWSWTVSAASEGVPVISGFGPTSPVTDNASDSRTFNITVDQTVNVSWYLNGSLLETDTSVTDANYTNTSAVEGTWNVTAVANNSNGTDQNVWAWTVNATGAQAPTISSSDPDSPVRNLIGETRTFTITVDQDVNVSWYINGTSVQSNTSVSSGTMVNYTNDTAISGIWNVTAVANNSNGTVSKQWTWTASDAILTLNSGWNLVSVPFSLTNTSPFTGFTVLTYNASAAIPISDPDIEPLNSYWVNNSGNETTVALFKAAVDESAGGSGAPSSSISLTNGWNMVGPTGNVSVNASIMFGSIGSNLWRVASYNSTSDEYEFFTNSETAANKVSDLVTEPKVGYWVFVTSNSKYEGDGSIR